LIFKSANLALIHIEMIISIYRLCSVCLPGLEIRSIYSAHMSESVSVDEMVLGSWSGSLSVQQTSICLDDPFLFSFAMSTTILRHVVGSLFCHSVRMRGAEVT